MILPTIICGDVTTTAEPVYLAKVTAWRRPVKVDHVPVFWVCTCCGKPVKVALS